MRFFKPILLFLFFVSVSESALIYTSIDKDSLMVGDRIDYSVSIVTSPQETLSIVDLPDSVFGKMTVLDKSIKTISRSNSDSTVLNAAITTFDYDTCSIPSIPFLIRKSGRVDTLMSLDIPLKMLSAIVADSGDTIRLKDIKEPFVAGKRSYIWLWILLGIVLLCFTGYLLYRRIFKKEVGEQIPSKPPYEEAIESLMELEKRDLLAEGLFREFVFELSEILKRYIDRRFNFPVLESTTEEILDKLKGFDVDPDKKKFVKDFFESTHFVKFAKVMPERSAVLEMKDNAKKFIIQTKPNPEKEK